jgi:hypothetical protein
MAFRGQESGRIIPLDDGRARSAVLMRGVLGLFDSEFAYILAIDLKFYCSRPVAAEQEKIGYLKSIVPTTTNLQDPEYAKFRLPQIS